MIYSAKPEKRAHLKHQSAVDTLSCGVMHRALLKPHYRQYPANGNLSPLCASHLMRTKLLYHIIFLALISCKILLFSSKQLVKSQNKSIWLKVGHFCASARKTYCTAAFIWLQCFVSVYKATLHLTIP